LPLGFALLTVRLLQAGYRILIGKQSLLIASHDGNETESAVKEEVAGS